MKKFVQRVSILFLVITTFTSYSQDISGIWRGYFITDGGEQYKYEVQLDQTSRNSLKGVTYSYLDTRFYGKATLTGNFTKTSKAALIQEIRTVELRMAGGSSACIMKNRLVYSRSGREEFLEGEYTSSYEKTDQIQNVRKGGSCGGGKMFLRKVSTSAFYEEPFLRNKKTTTTPVDEMARNKPAAKKPARTPTVAQKKAPQKKPVDKQIEKPLPSVAVTKKPDDVVINKPVIVPKIPAIPLIIRDRKNELTKTITLNNTDVAVTIYDNGEIDDDTVSIYLNGALLLANKRLSNKPISFTMHLDEKNPELTVVMVAENLGRIPPNTSLMIVQDGDKRHQVSITSTEQKNAMVRFQYKAGETP